MTFIEILDQYGIPYVQEGHRHVREGWINLDCPWCGAGSGKFHLGYNVEKNYLSCWRCRGHGVLHTLAEITKENREVLRKLLEGLDVKPSERSETVRGTLVLPRPIRSLLASHADYLSSRGFVAQEVGILWNLESLDFGSSVRTTSGILELSYRIFIPIRYQNEIVSWTTRSVVPEVGLRYISAPAECERMNHKHLLYGEEFARHAVCCVEGPASTWAMGKGAVGVSGTGFTRQQVARLSRYLVRGICFDSEPQAQRVARDLCDQLSVFEGDTFNIELETGKDPAEAHKTRLGRLEIKAIRKKLGLLP